MHNPAIFEQERREAASVRMERKEVVPLRTERKEADLRHGLSTGFLSPPLHNMTKASDTVIRVLDRNRPRTFTLHVGTQTRHCQVQTQAQCSQGQLKAM